MLILQRHPAVARAWARYLDTFYDSVEVLQTTHQVAARLKQAGDNSIDVVTGNWFGQTERSGSDCVRGWRQLAALRHVVIASALPPTTVPVGVLAVVHKPCGPEALLRWLQPARYQSLRAA